MNPKIDADIVLLVHIMEPTNPLAAFDIVD